MTEWFLPLPPCRPLPRGKRLLCYVKRDRSGILMGRLFPKYYMFRDVSFLMLGNCTCCKFPPPFLCLDDNLQMCGRIDRCVLGCSGFVNALVTPVVVCVCVCVCVCVLCHSPLFVCLSMCLSVYLSLCVHICLFVCPSVRVSVRLPVCLYVCMFACMHACMDVWMSGCV